MRGMTIAKLAGAVGVSVETVRFYQRRGLLPTPRPVGAAVYRCYDASHLARLRFIRQAQAAGFTLEDIGELLGLDPVGDRPRVREMAGARLAALDRRQAELERARVGLEKLLRTCERASRGPCPIISAFEPEAA